MYDVLQLMATSTDPKDTKKMIIVVVKSTMSVTFREGYVVNNRSASNWNTSCVLSNILCDSGFLTKKKEKNKSDTFGFLKMNTERSHSSKRLKNYFKVF